MLYGLLLTIFVIFGFLIILFVLIQQSKGSLGIGSMGGEAQMLFGGSGGQNFFQKATWFMGGTFMLLSLVLALMKSSTNQTSFLHKVHGATEAASASPKTDIAAEQQVQNQETTQAEKTTE